MEYKANQPFTALQGHTPRKVAIFQEGNTWLAAFPGTPFGNRPDILLAYSPDEGHVGAEVGYLKKLPRLTKEQEQEVLSVLEKIGYWGLDVQQPRTMQGKATITGNNRMEFFLGYLEAMFFTGVDDGGDDFNYNYTDTDLSGQAERQIRKDVRDFLQLAGPSLLAVVDDRYTWAHAGHDFWLTRNGHGSGFWDRNLPEKYSTDLTEFSEKMGEAYLYLQDDGHLGYSNQ